MQKKKVNKLHQKRLGRKLWILLGLAVSLLMATGWLFFSHSKAYQPPQVGNSDQVSPYLTHYLAQEVYNKSQLDKPFDLVIDQHKLNEALASEIQWPQCLGDVSFSEPMVVFGDEAIYLMGQLKYKELVTVITITLAPTFSGNQITLNIQSIRLGQLPAKFIVLTIAQQVLNAHRPAIEQDGVNLDVVDAIIRNGSFDPVIYPIDRPLRIKALSTKQGQLTVTLDPIPE